MVLETVQVLIAFPAHVASIRLVFLHSEGARIGGQCFGIDNGIRPILIVSEPLAVVTML